MRTIVINRKSMQAKKFSRKIKVKYFKSPNYTYPNRCGALKKRTKIEIMG